MVRADRVYVFGDAGELVSLPAEWTDLAPADPFAAVEAREQAMAPERTRHLGFGDVAAVWGMLQKLGVAAVIDEAAGPRPGGLPLPPGTYLALAALNRVVAPCVAVAGPGRDDRPGRGRGLLRQGRRA